jgi:uncharacterized protein
MEGGMAAVSLPQYDVVVVQDVPVPMRDGVRLACDIYFPAQGGQPLPGPWPVVLERTPYNKRDPERRERHGVFYAVRGYVAVLQDCRGCFASEGELFFLAQEANDGHDTLAWLVRQPWCNGKIGTFGTSYMAWAQMALATQSPPGLACMLPNMGGWNAWTSSVRHNGAFELRFLAWAFWHAALNQNRALKGQPWIEEALNRVDVRDWLRRLPLRPGLSPLALVPSYERWLFALLTRGDYDAFWRQPGLAPEEHLETFADVPIYLSGGWYDSYTRAVLEAYQALSGAKRGPVKVIMGPWTHGERTMEVSFAGDVEFGPEAALSSLEEFRLRWFDRWLKGVPNGVEEEPPVKIFVMGGGSGVRTREGRLDHGGRWRAEGEWPLARTRYTPFYFHPNGLLLPFPPTVERACTTYRFDPRDPVPTIGGNFSSLDYLRPLPAGVDPRLVPGSLRREPITPAGGFDQRTGPHFYGCSPPYLPLAARPDVLVFQTPPLEQDVEVTGPITAHLWFSSSAVDTDVTVKLIDVYPPSPSYPEGYALLLTDTILRCRYRNGKNGPGEVMRPGEIYHLVVPLYPTSNLFKAGHRIRVDISSSNFPRFDVNPNTGDPLGQERRWVVAENTLWHDGPRPSHILLPLIPP